MINNKSFNRAIAESLFNLAKGKQPQVELAPSEGKEARLFEVITIDTPLDQSFIALGDTALYTLNGTPARADLLDVYVNDVLQQPAETYETIDDAIQFFEIPPAGSDIYIKFR